MESSDSDLFCSALTQSSEKDCLAQPFDDDANTIAKYVFSKVSDQKHNSIWPLEEVRPYLIDGEKKLPKIPEDQMNQLKSWFDYHNLSYKTRHGTKQQITLQQAHEIVHLFYRKEDKKALAKGILKSFPNENWYMFLIGCPSDVNELDEDSKLKSDELNPQKMNVEFEECKLDIEAKIDRVTQSLATKIKISLIAQRLFLEPHITKEMFLLKLKAILIDVVDKKCTRFLLYYTGHGSKENGAWKFNLDKVALKSEVTIEEILNLVAKSGFKGDMEITSDSCYSGKLCHRALKFWQQRNENGLNLKSLKIQASSYKNKKSKWGEYRKYQTEARKLQQIREEERKIRDKYADEYGMADFRSKANNGEGDIWEIKPKQ